MHQFHKKHQIMLYSMRFGQVFIVFTICCLCSCTMEKDEHQETTRESADTQVALLGTIHLAGTGDIGAPKVKDVMGEKRQNEIDSLLSKLASFKPNKVLVEMVIQKQDSLSDNYQAYLKDQFELTASEIDQHSMKSAKRLGHDSNYAAH